MYGVTWSNDEHSVAQTGYVYSTVEEARDAAKLGLDAGPYSDRIGTQVDAMCKHLNAECGVRYGVIQTEVDDVEIVRADG